MRTIRDSRETVDLAEVAKRHGNTPMGNAIRFSMLRRIAARTWNKVAGPNVSFAILQDGPEQQAHDLVMQRLFDAFIACGR